MPDGKWISGLTSEMPLETAARNVLAARLEVVHQLLPQAIHHGEEDPENVHQLRVATRRADAGVRIFRCCLSGKAYRRARARLRTIRRAAGAARDWDVFLLELRERIKAAADTHLAGLDFLAGFATGQRGAAQASLEGVDAKTAEPFAEFIAAQLDELRDPRENGSKRLIDLARSLLSELIGTLHEKATRDLQDYERLHEVRIAGKRLRYALEVFADCFGPVLREEIYPRVEEMQEILGRANDSHVALVRLRELRSRLQGWKDDWQRLQPGFEAVLRFHQRRLPQERRRFLKWWENWRAFGVEAVFAEPAAAVPG